MLNAIASWIIHVISTLGYAGVALLMAIESAAIPLPSEIIMPFSGFLAQSGRFTLVGISLAGAIGSVIGSVVLYYVGLWGGRPFLEKYGKYLLISPHDLHHAEKLFDKYADISVFFGRVLPVVRTFISFPAGVSKAPMRNFIIYTFLGSFIWSMFLGWIGMKLGANWDSVRSYFHKFDVIIVALVIVAAFYWIYRHIRHLRRG